MASPLPSTQPIVFTLDELVDLAALDEARAILRTRARGGEESAVFRFEGRAGRRGEPRVRFATLRIGDADLDAGPAHPALSRTIAARYAPYRYCAPGAGDALDGLLMGLTDCTDPARMEEFDAWYDEHHASDVIRSRRFHSARRYRRVAGEAPEFLALYGCSGSAEAALRAYLDWPSRDRAATSACVIRDVQAFDRMDRG